VNQLIESTLEALVHRIETGTGNWIKDWADDGMPQNWTTKRYYHGVNVLLLWAARANAAYPTSQWATYKQWLASGYQVKSGERSSTVFITKDALKRGGDKDNPEDHYRLLRGAFVFNAAQLTLPPPVEAVALTPRQRDAACDALVEATGADIRAGPSPRYTMGGDFIEIPDIDYFTSTEGYYATLFHELVHWTGAKARLDRPMGGSDYAAEELVAELGQVFVCAEMGVTSEDVNDNNAAYLRSWLGRVPDKGKALMAAASKASKAHEYLMVSRETKEDLQMAS
jgi:antirestriction protein ArdC